MRVLQVSSGEQVEACRNKTSENSDNLMDINKNMAKLGEEILGNFGDFTIAENFSDKSSSN